MTLPRDVGQWNDELAREHDINDYYERSHPLIRWIERRRLEHIRSLLDVRPGQHLLEVGCGGGHVLRLFPEAELCGVDVSAVMLEKARQNLAGYRVTLHQGELGSIGLAAASFDQVVCTEVLEHVVEPRGVLEHMRRLLRPDGVAVITMPNDPLINRLKQIAYKAALGRRGEAGRVAWGGDRYHLHVWTTAQMRELLRPWFRITAERFAPHSILPIRCCFRCIPR